jgi:hypothetical protein
MADANLGTMLSTTLKEYRDTLTDNIHGSNAVFFALKDAGAIKTEDGGERIVEPLMYGKNETAGSYSGYDELNVTPQEGIDAAEFNWKQYSASISISGKEQRQNKGKKTKIIDLLQAKTDQAELSLRGEMTTGLFSNGTGNGSKDLTGLEAMVAATGIYGGINSATYTWWQSHVESTSEALGLARMRTAFNTASIAGKDHCNLIVTTQTLFEKYEGLFTVVSASQVAPNFTTPSEGAKRIADGGFQMLQFKGQPIVWDESCPSGTMYFLNTKHMKLVVHEDANFETTEFQKPVKQDALVAQILWMGNLTCNRRKSFAKLTAKT